MNKSARILLPFLVLVFVVMGCTKLGRQDPGKYEQQLKVAELLNAKYSLRNKLEFTGTGKRLEYDCQFKFEVGVENDRITLVVYFCESTSTAMKERKLGDVLTPENTALIKDAGFEQVVLHERISGEVVG